MMGIVLVTNPNSLRVRPGKPATADIWLVINGTEFPKQPWNDFAIVILGWWSTALLKLLSNASEREVLNFMDGPYSVEISKAGSGMLRFRAIEGLNRNNEVSVCESPALPFVAELVSQSEKILDESRRRDWWSNDADFLRTSLDALVMESFRLQG